MMHAEEEGVSSRFWPILKLIAQEILEVKQKLKVVDTQLSLRLLLSMNLRGRKNGKFDNIKRYSPQFRQLSAQF